MTMRTAKRKTATINVHHVFGTPKTVYADVMYRGVRRWHAMQNENPQAMADKAQAWARTNGFTHVRVIYD